MCIWMFCRLIKWCSFFNYSFVTYKHLPVFCFITRHVGNIIDSCAQACTPKTDQTLATLMPSGLAWHFSVCTLKSLKYNSGLWSENTTTLTPNSKFLLNNSICFTLDSWPRHLSSVILLLTKAIGLPWPSSDHWIRQLPIAVSTTGICHGVMTSRATYKTNYLDCFI